MKSQSIYSLEVYRIYGQYKGPEQFGDEPPFATYESSGPFGCFNVGDGFSEKNVYCGTIKHISHDIGDYDDQTILHLTRLYVDMQKDGHQYEKTFTD